MNKIADTNLTILREIVAAFMPVGVVDLDDAGIITGINLPGQCNGEASIGLKFDPIPSQIVVSPRWPMSKLPENKHNYSKMVTPRDLYAGEFGFPSIRISAKKDAATIVKEIFRRFLPGYLPVLAKCLAQRDANDKYTVDSKNAFDTVKNAASIGTVPARSYGNTVTVPEGDLTVNSSDYVTATLSLTLANTLKLIEFLKTLG